MKKELIEEIIRINHLNNSLNESIIPAGVKFLKNLISKTDDTIFRTLFTSVDEDAVKLLRSKKASTDALEDASQKLLSNINYSNLAEHLINNKTFGYQVDSYIDNIINLVESGKLSPQEAKSKINDVFTKWANGEGIPGVKDELVNRFSKKIPNLVSVDETIRNVYKLANVPVDPQHIETLTKYSNKILKLNDKQISELVPILTKYGSDIKFVIAQSKEFQSQADKLTQERVQRLLDNTTKYLNMVAESTGKVKKMYLLFAFVSIIVTCFIVGVWVKIKNINIPFVGTIGDIVSEGGGEIISVIPDANSITTEKQLRDKYPCVNSEPGGVTFSPIENNKTTITFSDNKSYELTINGDKVTYTLDGTSLC
jgi:polyhydroxyalkanoate synthesis regulator phasin